MIIPTIGRVVWFHPHKGDASIACGDQPLAALVTYVHSDTMVNLAVFDVSGKAHSLTSVYLKQNENEGSIGSMFCEWMPYQKGQAAKTEALEAKLA